MTEAGFDLIRMAEGFRDTAYRDPVGIWTIGYGHTSMAGQPRVIAGMSVSRAQADAILRRDVGAVAIAVRKAIAVPVNEQQFSALVSFCYNVGIENFRKSSVLHCINRSEFAAVPRRLALWNKAGGKVLPGLVKRRAAEAAMFLGDAEHQSERADAPLSGKPAYRSTTILAAILLVILNASQSVFGDAGAIVSVVFLFATLAAAIWIIRERIKKSKWEGL